MDFFFGGGGGNGTLMHFFRDNHLMCPPDFFAPVGNNHCTHEQASVHALMEPESLRSGIIR